MFKLKKCLVLLLVVVLIGGCAIKMEYNLKIKNDKSMDVSLIAGYDEEMISALASQDGFISSDTTVTEDGGFSTSFSTQSKNQKILSDEEQWEFLEKNIKDDELAELEEKGFKVAKYEDEKFKGFKYTKSFDNFEKIVVKDIDFSNDNETSIEEDNNNHIFTRKGLNYKAKIPFKTSSEMSSLNSYLEYSYVVTLPYKAISHNADIVSNDGKTLTWNFNSDKEAIEFEFFFISKYIICGVLLLLIIIIIIIIIRKIIKKKKNINKLNEENNIKINHENINLTAEKNISTFTNNGNFNLNEQINTKEDLSNVFNSTNQENKSTNNLSIPNLNEDNDKIEKL